VITNLLLAIDLFGKRELPVNIPLADPIEPFLYLASAPGAALYNLGPFVIPAEY